MTFSLQPEDLSSRAINPNSIVPSSRRFSAEAVLTDVKAPAMPLIDRAVRRWMADLGFRHLETWCLRQPFNEGPED